MKTDKQPFSAEHVFSTEIGELKNNLKFQVLALILQPFHSFIMQPTLELADNFHDANLVYSTVL